MLAYAEQSLASVQETRLFGAQLTYADVCVDVCVRMLSSVWHQCCGPGCVGLSALRAALLLYSVGAECESKGAGICTEVTCFTGTIVQRLTHKCPQGVVLYDGDGSSGSFFPTGMLTYADAC